MLLTEALGGGAGRAGGRRWGVTQWRCPGPPQLERGGTVEVGVDYKGTHESLLRRFMGTLIRAHRIYLGGVVGGQRSKSADFDRGAKLMYLCP